MDRSQARIHMLSRLFTVSLSVFLANFVLTWGYVWLWAFFTDYGEMGNEWLHLVLWVILPILVSLVTLSVGRRMAGRQHPETVLTRKTFYLLSGVLFGTTVFVSLWNPIRITWILSIISALMSIYIFKLWQLETNMEEDQA